MVLMRPVGKGPGAEPLLEDLLFADSSSGETRHNANGRGHRAPRMARPWLSRGLSLCALFWLET